MTDPPLVLIGDGDHAEVILDLISATGRSVRGICSNHRKKGELFQGHLVIGTDDVLNKFMNDEILLVNAVGSTMTGSHREKIYTRVKNKGYNFATLIHPSACIAKGVTLCEGVQIHAGVVLQTGVKIRENSIVNTRASLDHHCEIGPHCHISPGVVSSGRVVIGEGVHVGTGSILIEGIKVGTGAMVAAGAVVTKNVGCDKRVGGIPAKVF